MQLHPLLWLVLSGLFFAGGEYLSKKYVLHATWPLLITLCALYCLGALLWLPALKTWKDLSLVGTLWSVISLCMTILIGLLIFQEKLTTLQWGGVGLAIASIIMLSIGH